jgi:sterol desaturase/sphingolipid hydroxylase (fatty acid hydroxylase superfamily)
MVVMIAGLAILLGLEQGIPAVPGRKGLWRHGVWNLGLGIFNAVVLGLLAAPLLRWATAWGEERGVGLTRQLPVPEAVAVGVALVAFDGWMYLWHRANHLFPLLWRFHRLHHTDPAMDATTTVRFHPVEIAISTLLRLAVLPVLGLKIPQLLLYELILFPVILFHHSNVRFPERIDRVMRVLLVTPAMHRVHHSKRQPETDSNYGSVLSVWDRLGRSFRLRRDDSAIEFGL